MSRQGPALRVVGSCEGCEHLRSEYYCIEDGNDCDSGFDKTCAHPSGKRENMYGDTPSWCPYLPASLDGHPLALVLREVVALSPDDDSIYSPSGTADAYREIRALCNDDDEDGDEVAIARRDLLRIARVALAGVQACDAAKEQTR